MNRMAKLVIHKTTTTAKIDSIGELHDISLSNSLELSSSIGGTYSPIGSDSEQKIPVTSASQDDRKPGGQSQKPAEVNVPPDRSQAAARFSVIINVRAKLFFMTT